ncbi:MAG: ABC transporter permease subunit [Verrucomicrobiota bacterium]
MSDAEPKTGTPSAPQVPELQQMPLFSPARAWAIARNTFTQMVRMKVFYFVLIFALFIIGAIFIFGRISLDHELRQIKDVSIGSMRLFAGLFAIVGTALLIPRDVEDRTLYTILSKPVPRFEYLLGKLLGMILLIGVSLIIMTAFFFAILYLRQVGLMEEQIAEAIERRGNITPEIRESIEADIRANGVSIHLLGAVLAVFLQGSITAAIALLVSTIASSTLFTVIVSTAILFIGHVQQTAREFYFEGAELNIGLERFLSAIVSILFPDYQIFNIYDGVISGEPVTTGLMGKLLGFAVAYVAVYLFAAYLFFAKKEL